jgi:hypothetical protein
MNINKNENSLKNNLYDANKITSKKIKLFNLFFLLIVKENGQVFIKIY